MSATGVGESARLIYTALEKAGYSVSAITQFDAGKAIDFNHTAFDESKQNDHGPSTCVFVLNPPLLPFSMLKLPGTLLNSSYTVGVWAWELESFPKSWASCSNLVNEIWVPSEFVKSALSKVEHKKVEHKKIVRVVPHPLLDHKIKARHNKKNTFTYLSVFNFRSGYFRKNPEKLIEAFQILQGQYANVRLVFKISGQNGCPKLYQRFQEKVNQNSGITVISQHLSDSEMSQLYQNSDVLVSVHRCEGFGLDLAKAILTGMPVIATGWSGNLEFMSKATSILLDYELISVSDPQKIYNYAKQHWAQVNTADLVYWMKKLMDDSHYCNQIVQSGFKYTEEKLSLHAFVKNIDSEKIE